MANKKAILEKLLKHGKIDKARYDKAVAKVDLEETAKDKYKKNKAGLTKADLQQILDTLMG